MLSEQGSSCICSDLKTSALPIQKEQILVECGENQHLSRVFGRP